MSATGEHDRVQQRHAFEEWLQDGPLDIAVAWKYEHGDWFCLIEQFDIIGTGPSERDAFRDALGLLGAYLFSFFKDGRPISDALRPIPLRLRAEIWRDVIAGGLLQRVRRKPAGHESKVVVLPEQVAAFC